MVCKKIVSCNPCLLLRGGEKKIPVCVYKEKKMAFGVSVKITFLFEILHIVLFRNEENIFCENVETEKKITSVPVTSTHV